MRSPSIARVVLGFSLVTSIASGQGLRPTPRLSPLAETDAVRVGTSVRLALQVALPAGFHVQSNAPRDPSLIPTSLTLSAPAGMRIDEITYPRATDFKLAGVTPPLAVFGPEFVIGVRVTLDAGVAPGALELRGKLLYQACDDRVCYQPVTADVAWPLRIVAANAAVAPRHAAVFAQLAQNPAPAAAAAPPELVAEVRAANAAGNFALAEKLVADARAARGLTPEVLLAHSWLARGALAAGQLDRAETLARETHRLGLAELQRRPMDQDTVFPTAFGASIEVLGTVAAQRGARSEAVSYLEGQLRLYGQTSIAKRIQKNINLLSLEGTPAPVLDLSEQLPGATPPTLAALKGRVVLLFFWAHWCADCKAQGPILERVLAKYGARGLTVLAPTQRYGYAAAGASVGPAEEARYIAQVRETSYPWLARIPVPLSAANHLRYGVSTTPTLVLVDREGLVRLYKPGRLTEAELEAAVEKLL